MTTIEIIVSISSLVLAGATIVYTAHWAKTSGWDLYRDYGAESAAEA